MSVGTQPACAYRIGAVSRLTGVPADTLRVWERRYGVVEPVRTEGGSRLYSAHDVTRLGLIKRLVDAGHAIGTVANLSLEQLESRAADARATQAAGDREPRTPLALVVVGATLPLRFAEALREGDGVAFRLIGSYPKIVDCEAAAGELHADVLIVELPTLDDDRVARVRRMQRLCGARRLVVVYAFASQRALFQVEELGVLALRFPVTWEELRRLCAPELPVLRQPVEPEELDGTLAGPVPVRRFDDRQLAVIAGASTAIRCECPHHLSDLVLTLARFEQYCAECENRSREDAALHASLHLTTARARAMLEAALQRLVDVEGIDVDARG